MKKDGLPKIFAYSSSAAAFLATVPQAKAQIVYTDVDPDASIEASTFDIDFDGDGTTDISLLQSNYLFYGSNVHITSALVPAGNEVIGHAAFGSQGTIYAYPSVMAAGDMVGPGDDRFRSQPVQRLGAGGGYGDVAGQWGGHSGYLGCRFLIGTEVHYGWIEMAVASNSVMITVSSFAYRSTPDMAIESGDAGSTGVDEGAMTLAFSASPNPTRDRVSIAFRSARAGAMQMSLMNDLGQVLETREVLASSGSNTVALDLSAYPAATYFVRLSNADRTVFRKVVRLN